MSRLHHLDLLSALLEDGKAFRSLSNHLQVSQKQTDLSEILMKLHTSILSVAGPSVLAWAPSPVVRSPPRTVCFDKKAEVLEEAEEALQSVGWSVPGEGELSSDDPFVQAIDQGIRRDVGVPLDELLNPAKVVNLERDLYELRTELAELTGATVEDPAELATACDGGGGGEAAEALRQKIAKKETDLTIERRSVFRGWLKNVFLGQAVLSFALSFVMATNPSSLFGGYDWFYSYNMDISIRVLGYWWWWLFIVPSLRSRRPKGPEKKALDIAFLASPAISLVAPVATKDTALIWAANFVVVAASYGFAFLTPDEDDDDDDSKQPAWLKFLYKSLDFGTGRERGARQ